MTTSAPVAQQPAPGSTAEYEQWVSDGRPVAQQPQAEPHKPLFADLIAQHPGLREELLEMDKQPQAEAVPPDVVRDAVAAEREACAALAQGYAGQVGDVAWAVAAAIRGRGNAAIAQQKGQP